MNVVVLGGTGFVGGRLVRELADRGHAVTAASRSPESEQLPVGVRTAVCDVTDNESVEAAIDGADVVVNLVALSPLFTPAGGNDRHETVHVEGTRNAVRAATVHGADRFVQLSALGADPNGPTAYIRAKGRAEEVVRESTIESVIVRPSVVFGEGGEFVSFTKTLTTPYITGLPGGGETRFQPIWVDDLAALLADCVESDEHAGRTYEFGGPDVFTLADIARCVHRADGRSLVVLPVPMPLARIGTTIAGLVPGVPMGPDQYRSLQFDNTVDENDVTAFGRELGELRTLTDYLRVATEGPDEPIPPRTHEGREITGPMADGSATEGPTRDGSSGGSMGSGSDDRSSRSVWTSRAALGTFAFLATTWHLPAFVDTYEFLLVRLLFAPAYLVMLLFYDAPWGLENAVYAFESVILGESTKFRWELGLLGTYYFVAVVATVIGRRVRDLGRPDLLDSSGESDGTRAS